MSVSYVIRALGLGNDYLYISGLRLRLAPVWCQATITEPMLILCQLAAEVKL